MVFHSLKDLQKRESNRKKNRLSSLVSLDRKSAIARRFKNGDSDLRFFIREAEGLL